jgi:hypothetical protein
MKHFDISIREAADWNNLPCTADPMTLAEVRENARFYGCKIWLQTSDGKYLGTVHASGSVVWSADVKVEWRTVQSRAPYWWATPTDTYAHRLAA